MLTCVVITLLGLFDHSLAAFELPSFLFILADDIGWADFGYHKGSTANTPRVTEWTKQPGTITMHDFHSGGTHCTPTRASVLTGRTPFRDCVFGTKGADGDDMTEMIDNFTFAPQRTWTIGNAVREASPDYFSQHFGKWHLGSLYNDSEQFGGISSSPVTHGFDDFNSTLMVAPTATTNCKCNPEWYSTCQFGHYADGLNKDQDARVKSSMCWHGKNGSGQPLDPGCSRPPSGCCYNYWWRNDSNAHGVSNLSYPVPADDASYIADSFIGLLERRVAAGHKPFLAQLSYHNNHIPYVATANVKADCAAGKTCKPVSPSAGNAAADYTSMQLDFYGGLNELDASIGRVLDALDSTGYRNNTMIWMTTDNGPVRCNQNASNGSPKEEDCPPDGFCNSSHFSLVGPGSAGFLRGRKRDIWEGGHRVPGIIAWPSVVGPVARESWETVITSDFLPTIMDILKVSRPLSQAHWELDGVSILPILRGEPSSQRCIGHNFNTEGGIDRALRCGKWKLVQYTNFGPAGCPPGAIGCHAGADQSCGVHNISGVVTSVCRGKNLLYDLSTDIGERHDLATTEPAALNMMLEKERSWTASIAHSIAVESKCPSSVVPPGIFP